jgi:hypothetical protein
MKKTAIISAAILLALVGSILLVAKTGIFRKQPTARPEIYSNFTYYEKDGAIVFSGCTENVKEITVPSEIDGLPVRYLSDNAFAGGMHWELERVTLPASVEYIGSWAFEDCSSLREINIENVREIGDMAFLGCWSLETVNIGKDTVKIGERAFGGTSFRLTLDPENTSYQFADGCLYTADGKTLVRANPDIQKYTPPDSVTAIAPGAFEFTDLKSITIPDTVTEIGAYAFYNCLGLTQMELPGSIRRIEEYTFTYCQNLTSVTLPDGLETIGREAFCDDFRMTSMKVPDSVKEIGANAIGFYYYDGDSCMRNKDFTLYCTPGSAAEQYAIDGNLHYELVRK